MLHLVKYLTIAYIGEKASVKAKMAVAKFR